MTNPNQNAPPKLPLLRAAFSDTLWALSPEKLAAYARLIDDRAAGIEPDAELVAAHPGYGARHTQAEAGSVIRVIPLHGPIVSRINPDMAMASGLTNPQAFAAAMNQAAADPRVGTIILDVDSPGGTVAGTQVAAAAVRAARNTKRVVAVANDEMNSAALWIASQATEVVATPTAIVGSIGIVAVHEDHTGRDEQAGIKTTILRSAPRKALGHPSEPLTPEARTDIMQNMSAMHDLFVQAVATGRGMSVDSVPDDGRTFVGQAAQQAGLIDRIASLDTVLMEESMSTTEGATAAAEVPTPTAAAPDPTAELMAEIVSLRAEVAALTRERQTEARHNIALTALGTANLPTVGTVGSTDLDAAFRQQLLDASARASTDEAAQAAVDALITERRALLGSRTARPSGPQLPRGSNETSTTERPASAGIKSALRAVGL